MSQSARIFLLENPTIIVDFYQIGYSFTFLLGFVGNIASLCTFSRATLRKISTGCLFIMLAISDISYLLMCLFDYLEFGFKISFYGKVEYSEFCRFRTYVMSMAQMASAWILVIISVDRWIRTRFPFKSRSICTPKKAFMVVVVMLIIVTGLNSHILMPQFGMLAPGFANGACGPNFIDMQYTDFYYQQWSIIQIVFSCIMPALLIIALVVDIMITVRLRKRVVIHPQGQAWQHEHSSERQKTLQKHMFTLMIVSVGIFLITTLPLAIGKIIFPQAKDLQAAAVQLSIIWTELGWFQSVNYALNFYVHCLTSKLFRKEFLQRMKCFRRGNRNQVRGIINRTMAVHTVTK